MQAVLVIDDLPPGALDAAVAFHSNWLLQVREALERSSLAIVLPPAPYDHTDWRRAAARDLARMAAPVRVNLIGGGSEAARAATLAYLEGAPGVTGQYLALHGS